MVNTSSAVGEAPEERREFISKFILEGCETHKPEDDDPSLLYHTEIGE